MDDHARSLFGTMTRTYPASGAYFEISTTTNLAAQVGHYYDHYTPVNFADPIFSDPYADYGGLGKTH